SRGSFQRRIGFGLGQRQGDPRMDRGKRWRGRSEDSAPAGLRSEPRPRLLASGLGPERERDGARVDQALANIASGAARGAARRLLSGNSTQQRAFSTPSNEALTALGRAAERKRTPGILAS